MTDQILGLLEQGGNVFRERWTVAASRGMPRNGLTGAPYRGVNVLLLLNAAMVQGFASNVWLTYRQAKSMGGQVRRGEKAVVCIYFQQRGGAEQDRRTGRTGEDVQDPQAKDGSDRRGGRLCKPFWLFNVAQVDGLPAAVDGPGVDARDWADGSPIVGAMRLIGGCRARIRHGHAHAAYAPRADCILMPDVDCFTSPEAYCATALHELVHWTGHPDRLARAFGQRFGDDAYAFEELVAELGSAFVLGHIGLLSATIEGHAAYLDAWLRVLRQDRTAILTAARLAGEAYEFILARQMPAVPDEVVRSV